MDTILQLVVIVILTLFEGVFVAAEIALVTIRRTRDRAARRGGQPVGEAGQGPDRAARPLPGRHPDRPDLPRLPRLGLCRGQPDGQPRGASSRGPACRSWRPRPGALALIIVTLLLSLFTIVFGELVPKSLALAHTEPFALRLSGFIVVLLRVLGPLVRRPDRDHDGRRPDARRGRPGPGRDEHRGAVDPRRARRRAGHPRGRGGADDPGGHRARRPAHPRGHGPAHRDGHAGGRIDAGGRDRHRRRGGPQPDPGLRGDDRRDRRHPVRQGPAAVPQGVGRRATEPALDPADARCSCPSR